jgi:hypothetical protein
MKGSPKKSVPYSFCSDFTSPKKAVQQQAPSSRVVGKDEQLSTARVLDEQLNKYRSA